MGPNELLYWLSARTKGSWTQFRNAVEKILGDVSLGSGKSETDDTEGLPLYQQIRFNLQQLGHVEFNTPGCEGGWRVAPPTLAITSFSSGNCGILCGARRPQSVENLQNAARGLKSEVRTEPNCPDIVRFIAESTEPLEDLARSVGLLVQRNAPESILCCLSKINDLEGWNAREACPPFGRDWKVRHFVVSREGCRWVESSPKDAERQDGLFQFTRFQTPEYYLRVSSRILRVEGQVGKFFELARSHRQVIRYDRERRSLGIPGICRPPF